MEERQLLLLLKKIVPDLEPTDKFNSKDATSAKLNLSIELKCRKQHYQYLLIEKEKYNKLILNDRARYICSTPLGIFSFNIKKLPEPKWVEMWMPDTTQFDRQNKIKKLVGFYNINDAKNIKNILNF